jgi:hypothetical protein
MNNISSSQGRKDKSITSSSSWQLEESSLTSLRSRVLSMSQLQDTTLSNLWKVLHFAMRMESATEISNLKTFCLMSYFASKLLISDSLPQLLVKMDKDTYLQS